MPTVRAMRSLFRNAAAIAASASLVFFWSCERHEVGELPDHQQHGKPGEGHHSKGTDHVHSSGHDDDKHGHASDKHGKTDKASHVDDKPNPSDGGMAQEGTGTPGPGQGQHKHDSHPSSQAIPPVGTPAQFFPSPTPH
ncbi:MAG TPA: hypothetical protein VK993_10010 [Chthoniobacterales bacterium]|nr:hypothetical protein [Chthoniobacterales bacterium]